MSEEKLWSLEDVGREMVNITTTVRSQEEWRAIPALWLKCMEERDSAQAFLAAGLTLSISDDELIFMKKLLDRGLNTWDNAPKFLWDMDKAVKTRLQRLKNGNNDGSES